MTREEFSSLSRKEQRKIIASQVQESEAKWRESEGATKEAARRVLEMSAELHLTWKQLEDVFNRVKYLGKIIPPPENPT